MISFWQVMDRAYNTGPLMKVEKFDMEVFRKATDLKNKFGVQFNPEIPVPESDDLADRVFQAGNVCIQCLNRHTNMICGGGGATAAGPGTEQQLFEIAALAIISAAAGGHIFHGFRKSKLVKPNQGTGMEPRWGGETAKACTLLTREEVNEIVLFLLSQYEDSLTPEKAPEGYAFQELYDPEKVQIRSDYHRLYEKVKAELTRRGLHYA